MNMGWERRVNPNQVLALVSREHDPAHDWSRSLKPQVGLRMN